MRYTCLVADPRGPARPGVSVRRPFGRAPMRGLGSGAESGAAPGFMGVESTMAYRGRDGRWYDHKETPAEYRRRTGGGGGSSGLDGAVGSFVMVMLFFLFLIRGCG